LSVHHLDNPGPASANGRHVFVSGASSVVRALERVVERVANTDLPVLILGEPGSGKRSLARELHSRSEFAAGGFHEFSASDFARELHKWRENGGSNGTAGTIFVQEIGELSPEAQAALMEYLSAASAERARVRVIASSSRDLDPKAQSGFRPDLYYVLSGVCLRVPALRHRKEDIPGLANHFVEHYCTLLNAPRPALSQPVQTLLQEHAGGDRR
jgi:DNA-binding NtrC family response regulator